jgi:hypothetical protein
MKSDSSADEMSVATIGPWQIKTTGTTPTFRSTVPGIEFEDLLKVCKVEKRSFKRIIK